jgi:hypothetical protein
MIGLYHPNGPQQFDKFSENVAREKFSVAIGNVSYFPCLFLINRYFICHNIQKHN